MPTRLRSSSRHVPRSFGAAVVVALMTLAAACGGGDAPAATPTPTLPSAEGLRSQVIETLRALSSVRFEITHPNGGTDMGAGLLLTTVQGAAAFPDRAEMSAKGKIGPAIVDFGIVQLADVTYFNPPIVDVWQTVEPGALPFDFIAMHESVAHALAQATQLTVAYGDDIGGAPTLALSGSIHSEDLRGLVPNAAEGLALRVTASMRRSDGLPVRVTLEGPLIGTDDETMVRHLDLSDFDAPVSIAPPI